MDPKNVELTESLPMENPEQLIDDLVVDKEEVENRTTSESPRGLVTDISISFKDMENMTVPLTKSTKDIGKPKDSDPVATFVRTSSEESELKRNPVGISSDESQPLANPVGTPTNDSAPMVSPVGTPTEESEPMTSPFGTSMEESEPTASFIGKSGDDCIPETSQGRMHAPRAIPGTSRDIVVAVPGTSKDTAYMDVTDTEDPSFSIRDCELLGDIFGQMTASCVRMMEDIMKLSNDMSEMNKMSHCATDYIGKLIRENVSIVENEDLFKNLERTVIKLHQILKNSDEFAVRNTYTMKSVTEEITILRDKFQMC